MGLKVKAPKRGERRLSYDAATRHLEITVGKAAPKGYWVDVGARTDVGFQFSLTKDRDTRKAGGPTCYVVCVSDDGADRLCECKAFEHRGHCCHADALAVLVARGRFTT